ncbi:hypothetical protein SARC_02482 [Sphaeroforma arctica JP610]|uniref:Uncharacterized protein n=1 Tax=Sphaeroforma arctica JP610 TaxID=667725 RepID=A0A0L0G8K3_9EUKA|nr:hypothetical protein SARC_02482 [Sphaeroforma arctica JP610]KNC85335.1 hypothetical protein SARC_02482 [Sphaeroforma arctica JP610]|eukprot:XP_014159237.1 hypothetical protein SARC_02482 [Sphaeroforma arctica JP610]
MRIKALVAHRMLLVPVTDHSHTFQWLLDECIRRAGNPESPIQHRDHTGDSADAQESVDNSEWCLYTIDGYELFASDRVLDVLEKDDEVMVMRKGGKGGAFASEGIIPNLSDDGVYGAGVNLNTYLNMGTGLPGQDSNTSTNTNIDANANANANAGANVNTNSNGMPIKLPGASDVFSGRLPDVRGSADPSYMPNLPQLNGSNMTGMTNGSIQGGVSGLSGRQSLGNIGNNVKSNHSTVSNDPVHAYTRSSIHENVAGNSTFLDTHNTETPNMSTGVDASKGELYNVEQLILDLQGQGYELPESVCEVDNNLNELSLPVPPQSQTQPQPYTHANAADTHTGANGGGLVPPVHNAGNAGRASDTYGTPLGNLRTPLSSQPVIHTGHEATHKDTDTTTADIPLAGPSSVHPNAQANTTHNTGHILVHSHRYVTHIQDRPGRSRRKPFRILLVRHGVSTANLDPSVYEYTPDHRIPLAPEGKTMARKAGEAISKYFYEVYKDPTNAGHIRMWHSPYLRAVQTAEAIRDSCGQWITDARENPMIAEIDYGLFEGRGRTFAQDLGMQKELTHYNLRAMHSGRFWARFPLGESPFDVCQRVAMFNGTIVRDRDNRANNKPPIDTIIVVSHGITLRVFMKMWCHRSLDWYENEWNGNNCSVRLVTSSGDNGYMFNGFDAHDCTVEAPGPSSYSKSRTQTAQKELKKRQGSIVLNKIDLPSSPSRGRRGSSQPSNSVVRTRSHEKQLNNERQLNSIVVNQVTSYLESHSGHSASVNSGGPLDNISEGNDNSVPETQLEKELGSLGMRYR